MIQCIPVRPTDEAFLFRLYAGTREAELEAWGWDAGMRGQFLQMQWKAQRMSYDSRYPGSDHCLIAYGGVPAGRVLVYRSTEALILVDISLLPEFCGRGIGTALIRELQSDAEALQLPLRLSVLPDNQAQRLYDRLGFRIIDDSGHHILMEWCAAPTDAAPSDILMRGDSR